MMTAPKARAMTYNALVQLKTALDAADTPEDFLAEADAILGRRENLLELPIDFGRPEELSPGATGAQGRDVDNAPLVYEYLGAMDPANASDRRLWSYLALATYRDYMEARWPLSDIRNWKSRVETRWLMLSATRGKLVRHGVARLWWVAALTHDPKMEHPLSRVAEDPFAYTRVVLRNEDRVNALFDREAGAITGLVRRVIEHVDADGSRSADKYLRDLMKEVTLIYGYRDIGALDDRALEEVVASAAPA
jgi:hypothetical protein